MLAAPRRATTTSPDCNQYGWGGLLGQLAFLSSLACSASPSSDPSVGTFAADHDGPSVDSEESSFANETERICQGQFQIALQADLAEISGCTQINGSLSIDAEERLDLTALRGLQLVSGTLLVTNHSQGADSFRFSLAGLDDLRNVGGLEISGVSGGLEPLSNLSGNISTVRLNNLTEVVSLQALSKVSISEILTVREMPSLGTLAGPAFSSNLGTLTASNCPLLTAFSKLTGLSTLQYLRVDASFPLAELALPETIVAVENIALRNLPQLETLTGMSNLQGVTSLQGYNLPKLVSLGGLNALYPESLQSLTLENCPALTQLDPLGGQSQLQEATILNCDALTDLTPLTRSAELRFLQLEENDGLVALPVFELVEEMEFLILFNHFNLLVGPQFPVLKSLTGGGGKDLEAFNVGSLSIVGNAKLQAIDGFPLLDSASHVQFIGNTRLDSISLLSLRETGILEVRTNVSLTQIELPLAESLTSVILQSNLALSTVVLSESVAPSEYVNIVENDALSAEAREKLLRLGDFEN